VKINFISEEEECQLLDLLIGEPFIGIDAEWKSHNSYFKGPAVLQLSSAKDVCLIDLMRLKNNSTLDS
jgi:hypothetical protein